MQAEVEQGIATFVQAVFGAFSETVAVRPGFHDEEIAGANPLVTAFVSAMEHEVGPLWIADVDVQVSSPMATTSMARHREIVGRTEAAFFQVYKVALHAAIYNASGWHLTGFFPQRAEFRNLGTHWQTSRLIRVGLYAGEMMPVQDGGTVQIPVSTVDPPVPPDPDTVTNPDPDAPDPELPDGGVNVPDGNAPGTPQPQIDLAALIGAFLGTTPQPPVAQRVHVDHRFVNAADGAKRVVIPEALAQEAYTTTGHQLVNVTDSVDAESLPAGVQVRRPYMSAAHSYPVLVVEFPAGSQGVALYSAPSNNGAIQIQDL